MKKKWELIYYETLAGKCPVEKFITTRHLKNQAKLCGLFSYLEEQGPNLPQPYVEPIEDGIYALHVLLSGKQVKTFYFFCAENYLVLTHGFIKTTTKNRKMEFKKTCKDREVFLQRVFHENRQEQSETRTFQQYLAEKFQDQTFQDFYRAERQILEMAFKIIHARQRTGLTQKELAKKARVKQQQLMRIENGVNCNMTVFLKVCQALGIQLDLKTTF